MGAKFWQPKSPTRLKKCSERISNSCTDETDGCCAVIACTYCLEFAAYDGPQYATAAWSGSGWTGTIAGADFRGFWERNYESGECEFVVTLDEQEVYRKSCYEGQSCRDSSDSAEVTIDYEDGVLTWTKQEFRPLEYRIDYETGCKTWFCGTCDCTTECLCIAINTAATSYNPGNTQYLGEICDVSYSNCEPPLWQGTVEGYAISLTLEHDSYGNCVLTGTIAGEYFEHTLSSTCSAINVTFELYDGTQVTVTNKGCSCAEVDRGTCMCGRDFGAAPTLSFYSANAPGTIHTITMSYSSNIDDGLICSPIMPCQGYVGRFDGTLALPMGGSRTEGIDFRIVCSLECSGYCFYFRFDSRFIDGWCKTTNLSFDCACPATIIYPAETNSNFVFPCTEDPWSYQIPEFVFEEDPTNCA